MSDSQAGCAAGCIVTALVIACLVALEAVFAWLLMTFGNIVLAWAQQPLRFDFGVAFAIVIVLSLLGTFLGRS